MLRRLFASLMLFTLLISASTAQSEQTLVVFAAASLTDAFEEIGADFEALHPNTRIIFNFDGSSTLAAQILEAAPVDVFASANTRQMQVVVDAGFADQEHVFAQNRLVAILPSENDANIQSLQDLAKPNTKLVVAAVNVPIRDYTDQMIARMGASPDYGTTFQEAFLANIVSEEANVRQVALKVALGEADAAIVYSSDVTPDLADRVIKIDIPDEFNTLAQYPIATLNTSENSALAQAFVDYVLSDDGQQTLHDWGFITVQAPATPPQTHAPSPFSIVDLLLLFIRLILS